MSRESMVSILLGEVYNCMAEDRPMDTRRIKRLMRLDGDFAETLNRGMACYLQSQEIRKERRRLRKRR